MQVNANWFHYENIARIEDAKMIINTCHLGFNNYILNTGIPTRNWTNHKVFIN